MPTLPKKFLFLLLPLFLFVFLVSFPQNAYAEGNCFDPAVPSSQKDESGEGGFFLNAPPGYYVSNIIVKSGQNCFPAPEGNAYAQDGIYENDWNNDGQSLRPNSCYQVTGIGTASASAERVGNPHAQTCQSISHIEVQFEEFATITIVKDAVPNDSQDFTFHNDFGGDNPDTFLLDDDATVALPKTRDFLVLPGIYSVSEDATAGWQLEDAVCDNQDAVGEISVESGDHVTCTFTNQKLAKITLIKNTIGGDGLFEFDLSGTGLPTDTEIETENGTGNIIFENLDPENEYSISEIIPPGWFLTGAVCTGTNTPDEITPNSGEDITCTFTNLKILDLEVTKTANTSFTRTFPWTINKSVTPETWDLFKGDTGTSEYTVSVVKGEGQDSNWEVAGAITIHNPNTHESLTATIENIVDVIEGVENIAVSCGQEFELPFEIAPDETIECTYSSDLPDGEDRTNTATVITDGFVPGGSAEADVIFGDPTNVENDEITVTDTYIDAPDDPWIFEDNDEVNYNRTFSCSELGTFEYDNTATIIETAQSDSASVQVNCYDPEVTKTAQTSLDRTWTWTIDKTADVENLTLSPGQTHTVNYDVTVDATSIDNNFEVQGEIDVHNTAPIPAVINGVEDVIENLGSISVDCGVTFPYTLAPIDDEDGLDHLICTYSSDLPDVETRPNTATATQQNFDYHFENDPTESGTTDYTGTALIDFTNADIYEIDESIDVTDSLEGLLGTVLAESAPHIFSYARNIMFETCGNETVSNTASFVTNDTPAQGSDSWDIDVNIPCNSCSLTQGYWKTHNEFFNNGKHPDDTWNEVLSEFLDGDAESWYETFINPPAGNPYYQLAHQYMATYLNKLNGANTSQIDDELNQTLTLLQQTTDPLAGLKGKTAAAKRQEYTSLASILAAFNEGTTNPAGHCDEQI